MKCLAVGPRERPARGSTTGYKRKRGSKAHRAVDTPRHLLAVRVTPACAHERVPLFVESCEAVKTAADRMVEPPGQDAQVHGIELQGIGRAEATKGFVPLPGRQRGRAQLCTGGTLAPLAGNRERRPDVLRGLQFPIFAMLMPSKAGPLPRAAGHS